MQSAALNRHRGRESGHLAAFHGFIREGRRELVLILEAIRLPGAHQQFHLAAFHLLLKQPEAGLLPQVEHLIDAVERLTHFGGDSRLEIVQRLELRPERLVLTTGL